VCCGRYQLFCLIVHFGATVGGGHYTAYTKGRFHDDWYYYDDDRVENVGEARVKRHHEHVYLLFYGRDESVADPR
jgi:ubiquitin C-terminal hydrolase